MYRRQIGCLIGMVILLVLVSVTLAGTVSEEARRHMTRGLAAVDMAKSPEDYEAAIREFQEAARLAPNWPDPHYNLGLVQEKSGKFREAVASLKEYLRLAPNAPDAAKIKEQIYKLEYKAEQVLTVPEIIDVLINHRFRGVNGHFKLSKGMHPQWGRSCRLRITDGQLRACDPIPYSVTPCMNNKNMDACFESLCQCLPVTFDGRKLEYECTYYHCPGSEKYNSCPWKFSIKREIVSTAPLQIRTREVCSQQFADRKEEDYEYLWEWVND